MKFLFALLTLFTASVGMANTDTPTPNKTQTFNAAIAAAQTHIAQSYTATLSPTPTRSATVVVVFVTNWPTASSTFTISPTPTVTPTFTIQAVYAITYTFTITPTPTQTVNTLTPTPSNTPSSVRNQVYENNNGSMTFVNPIGLAYGSQVSLANATNVVTLELRNLSQILDVQYACEAGGTSTLDVACSTDNSTYYTVDSVSTAASGVKHYNASTVGAALGIAPLSFKYAKITVGAAGSGKVSSLTVTAK